MSSMRRGAKFVVAATMRNRGGRPTIAEMTPTHIPRGVIAAAVALAALLLGTASASTEPSGGDGDGVAKSAAKRSASYKGKTSQGKPVSLKPSRRGVRFSVGWAGECDDGGKPFAGTTLNTKPLRLRKRRIG